MASATGGRTRELAGTALWALAAVAWVVAVQVPWFRAGVLGAAAPLDAAALVRSGVLGVPTSAGFLVAVPPLMAVVLLGLAPLRGPAVMAARAVLWLLLSAVTVAAVLLGSSISAGALGWGAGLVLAAAVLGAAGLCCATVRPPRVAPDGERVGVAEPDDVSRPGSTGRSGA